MWGFLLKHYSWFIQVDNVLYEAIEGDPRNVLCEAVEKHHASVLVVGSHGYGAIKRYTAFALLVNTKLS